MRKSSRIILVKAIVSVTIFVLISGIHIQAEAAKDKIAVLIEQDLYSGVSVKFDRYIEEVEERFPVELMVFNAHHWEAESPENIRDFLIGLYQSDGIKGAVLVGMVPFAVWKQTFGTNDGISSIFYEDMDGSFTDTNADGKYDHHTFGANEGPEIWVCWMRPPDSDPAFYLNRLFDKTHDYYTGTTVTNKRAFVAGHEDYDNNIWDSSLATAPRCVNIYGAENVDTDGVGSDLTYESDIKNNLNNIGYEMFDTWQHANSTLQAWDSGYMYSSEVMPMTNASLMTFIYGCHSADFWLSPGTSSFNINIATAYPFGESIGQAATGTSWSYGSEYKYMFIESMGDDDSYFGEAWFEMEAYVETRSFVQARYPGRDPSGECAGNNLIGNPFLIVKYTATGDSDSDGVPDWFEYRHKKPTVDGIAGLDRWVYDSSDDPDNDGLDNIGEYNENTDPTDPDTDGDGMSDGYEADYDLDPLNDDSGEDPDVDGFTNYQEFIAGTDPRDWESALRMIDIQRHSAPILASSVTITWQSVKDKVYVIEYCDDPYDEPMNWIMCDGVLATGSVSTWTDDGGDPTGYVNPDDVPHRYYRVEVYTY